MIAPFGFGVSMLAFGLFNIPVATLQTYAVVYESADATGMSVTRETLAIATQRGREYVEVRSATGAMATFPATLGADGEIENEPAEAALTCYNMAVSLVAERTRAPLGPLPFAVVLGDSAVQVPLGLVRSASTATRTTVAGRSGPAVVDARFDVVAGALVDATIAEFTIAGAPERVTSRTTCSIARSDATQAVRSLVGT